MAYFGRFPLVRYNGVLQVNLTTRADLISAVRDDPAYFYEYVVEEGESPELIADRFYDDIELAWVVLMANQIVNVFEEWPKSYHELEEYIREKYPNPNGIHHYESISSGVIVDSDYPLYDRRPVTNTEYEERLNDEKRNIKLILPDFIGDVISMHKELMRL